MVFLDNKKLGAILIILSVALLAVLVVVRGEVRGAYQGEIDKYVEAGKSCPSDPEKCPHEQRARALIPVYLGGAVSLGVLTLGLYLLLFEKSQKEVAQVLEKQKEMKIEDEKFQILMKGLGEDEQKVMEAVREQDGITQNTLGLRTDIHKSKLSMLLKKLEERDLVKKKPKGRTNQVFLKADL